MNLNLRLMSILCLGSLTALSEEVSRTIDLAPERSFYSYETQPEIGMRITTESPEKKRLGARIGGWIDSGVDHVVDYGRSVKDGAVYLGELTGDAYKSVKVKSADVLDAGKKKVSEGVQDVKNFSQASGEVVLDTSLRGHAENTKEFWSGVFKKDDSYQERIATLDGGSLSEEIRQQELIVENLCPENSKMLLKFSDPEKVKDASVNVDGKYKKLSKNCIEALKRLNLAMLKRTESDRKPATEMTKFRESDLHSVKINRRDILSGH